MKYLHFRTLITLITAFYLLFLSAACSSVTSSWPPTEEEQSVTIVGPIFIPQFGSSYRFSQMTRRLVLKLYQNQRQLKARLTDQLPIKLKLEDWILEHDRYRKTWGRIFQEAKTESGDIDNLKLAAILKESGIHTASHVLVIHVKTSTDNPKSVQIEGYRYLNLSEDEVVANMFRVNVQIANKDPEAEIEAVLKNLVTSNDFASPSFEDIGFVNISEGCFQMGSSPDDEVCVDDFRLSKTPVTQQQWTAIMKRNHALNNQGDLYPVTNVSWEEVQNFLEILNDISDKEYRLPTEAEWEYACRNLGQNQLYGTVDGTISHQLANFAGKSDLDTWASTSPIGMFPANPLGLYDMSGNVWEWTQDREHKRNFVVRFLYNYLLFMIPEKPVRRVVRGGSFDSPSEELRCDRRDFMYSKAQSADLGFRLVLED